MLKIKLTRLVIASTRPYILECHAHESKLQLPALK
jgi:hypothetical protein